MNNFEDIVNCRVDIREDIKHYQDTLSYTSSKVDFSVGENIYMLPGDINLKIRSGTVGYNNKVLVSDGKFSLGKNDKVNSLVLQPVISTPKIIAAEPSHNNELSQKPTITHNQEPQTITQTEENNCYGTLSDKWFCNMEYV